MKVLYTREKTSKKAGEEGLENPLRPFVSHSTATLLGQPVEY